jgi:hypothetical protein
MICTQIFELIFSKSKIKELSDFIIKQISSPFKLFKPLVGSSSSNISGFLTDVNSKAIARASIFQKLKVVESVGNRELKKAKIGT